MGPRPLSTRANRAVARKIQRQFADGPSAQAELEQLQVRQRLICDSARATQKKTADTVALQAQLIGQRDEAILRGSKLAEQAHAAAEAENAAARSLAAAQRQLQQLEKKGFSEMKAMKVLPRAVETALIATCVLLGEKPARGRLLLANPGALTAQLLSLELLKIPAPRLDKVRTMLLQSDLTVATMFKASRAGVSLVRWLWGVFDASASISHQTLSRRAGAEAQSQFDQNAAKLEALEMQLQDVAEQLASLQDSAIEQVTEQRTTAAALDTTKARREEAAQKLTVVNWAQELSDAVRRHDHPSLKTLLDNLTAEDISGMFYQGATPLHTAAIYDNHEAAAALLAHGGPELLLQGWWDPATVYQQICRRTTKARQTTKRETESGEGSDNVQNNALVTSMVTLTQVRLVARDARASNEACAELELLQPGGGEALKMLFDSGAGDGAYAAAAAAAAAGTELVVSEAWFRRWWPKARPTESPLLLACSNGWSETAAVILAVIEQQAASTQSATMQQIASAEREGGATPAAGGGDSSVIWGLEVKRAFHLGVCRGQTDVAASLGRASFFHHVTTAVDARGYSAVWNAVRRGDVAMVQTLAALGCDLRSGGPGAPGGQRPLHGAARMGHLPMIAALLAHQPETGKRPSWEDRDAHGATAMHTAARHGQVKVIREYYLPKPVASSAVTSDRTASNNKGNRQSGKQQNHEQSSKAQNEFGLIVGSQDLVDRFGRSALDVAVLAGSQGLLCVAELVRIRHVSNVTAELKQAESLPGWDARMFKGAGVSTDRWTLLHGAAAQGLPSVVKLVLAQSAFAEAPGQIDRLAPDPFSAHSWTPLMLAASSNAGPAAGATIALLSEAKAALDVRNENQWDAIWMAANSGNSGAVEQLLQAGADPWSCDLDGVDAMMAAALSGNTHTIRLLLSHFAKAPKKARRRISAVTLSTVLIAGLMQPEQASDLVAKSLHLGVRADSLDIYGRSAMQHALASDRPHTLPVYAQLARAGGTWLQRVRAGQSTLALLDWSVDHVHARADSTELALTLGRLSRQLRSKHDSGGAPGWIKDAVEGLHKLAKRGGGSGSDGGSGDDGGGSGNDDEVDDTARSYSFAEITSCIAKARSMLLFKMSERERRLEVLGLDAYQLSLHRYILEMDVGAQWVLWKYPTLAKQSSSQVDPLQRTPLMVACLRKRLDWLDILLGLTIQTVGSRKRLLDAADLHGRTALHYSVMSSSKACVVKVLALRPQLLERETKPQAPSRPKTAYELARALRREAERELAAVKYTNWVRPTPGSGSCRTDGPRKLKLVVTVDLETLKQLERQLRACKDVERHLLQAGARGSCGRSVLRLGRWLMLVVAVPTASITGLLALTIFTLSTRTSRLVHAPLLAHKLLTFPWGSMICTGLLIGSVCATAFSSHNWLESWIPSSVASMVLVAVTLAIQLAVTAHMLLLYQSDNPLDRRHSQRAPAGTNNVAVAQQETVNLFQKDGGCGLRSAALLMLTLVELPQLLGIGGGTGFSHWYSGVFPGFSAQPTVFACHDSTHCRGQLVSRILAAGSDAFHTNASGLGNGSALAEQTQASVCASFPDGLCDGICGRCQAPHYALVVFATICAGLACIWVLLAGIVLLSVGLAGGVLPVRRWLPALRADIWRLPGYSFWETVCCHALYMPVVSALLNLLDCRLHEYTDLVLYYGGVSSPQSDINATGNPSVPSSSASLDGKNLTAEIISSILWQRGDGLHDGGWMWPTTVLTSWNGEALISLASSPDTECWVGWHGSATPVAMLLLLLYQIATGVFPLLFRQSVSYGEPAVAVPPRFDALTRTIKLTMLLLVMATSGQPIIASTVAVGGQAAMVVVCACVGASEHCWLHRLRLAIYLTASVAAALRLAALLLCAEDSTRHPVGSDPVESTHCSALVELVLVCGLLLGFVAAWHVAVESTNGRPPWVSSATVVRKLRKSQRHYGSMATVTPAVVRTTSHGEPEPSLGVLLSRVQKILARSVAEPELGLGGVTEHEATKALHMAEGHVGFAINALQQKRAAARKELSAVAVKTHGNGGKQQQTAGATEANAVPSPSLTVAELVERRIEKDIEKLILTDGYSLLATRSQRQERNGRRPRSLPPLAVVPQALA